MQVTCIKNLPSQLNEVGKIKIGMKGETVRSSGGKEFKRPQKLDHFILTTTEKDEAGNYIQDAALMDELKKDATLVNNNGDLIRIPIRLLYDSTELNFPTRYVSYNGGKLSCYGDGEQSFKRIKNNFTEPCSCPCPRLDGSYTGKDKCKATGALTCVIDGSELFGQAHKFRTTSINSVKGIMGGIKLIQTATKGRIAGLPLMLTVNAKTTVTPQGHNTTVYVVSLCYHGNMADLRSNVISMLTEEKQYLLGMDAIEQAAMEDGAGNVGLEPDSDEEREFVEEFFPDARGVETGGQNTPPPSNGKNGDDGVIDVTPEQPKTIEEPPQNSEDSDTEESEAPDVEESKENYLGEFPVGPYKKVYNSLMAEDNPEKAMAFLKRLQKPNIQYWLSTEHPSVEIPEKALKPQLLKIAEKLLIGAAPKDSTISTAKELIQAAPENLQGHELIDALKHATSQKEAADICLKYFSPTPIDRTQSTEELVEMSLLRIGKELETAQPSEEKVDPEPEETKVEPENVEQERTDPSAPGNTYESEDKPEAEKETDPRAFDDSDPITRDQKLSLAKLKKLLESQGKLKPERWELHVGYFFGPDNKPLKSAKDMTTVQGETFINMLKIHVNKAEDVIPF